MKNRNLQYSCSTAILCTVFATSLLAEPAFAADTTPLQAEVADLLEAGYPPSVIYYHTVSKGARIYQAVDAAVLADPGREPEFRNVGVNMLSYLPPSACGPYGYQVSTSPQLRRLDYEYEGLGEKTVAEVARRFFENGDRLTRLQDGAHGLFPVNELADLAAQGGGWYNILPVRNHPIQDGVFVALYRDGQQVVVDANLDRVRQAQEAGLTAMPVVFQYIDENEIPVSRLPGAGKDVLDKYRSETVRVSAGPNWKNGDYVAHYKLENLEEMVDLPEREDIDEDLWQRIEADLNQNGFSYPAMVRISASGVDLFNSPERVAVAKARGDTDIPVTFIYELTPTGDIPAPCSALISSGGGPPPAPPLPPKPPQPPLPPSPSPSPSPTPTPTPPVSE